MNPHLLMRLAHLLRHPPRGRRLLALLVALGLSLAIAGIEALWGWPEALTVARMRP